MNKNIKLNYFLWMIICAGALLRIFNLGYRSLSFDEVGSIAFVTQSFQGFIHPEFWFKLLYFVFLKIWTCFFGIKEIAVRSPSVLFGVLSIVSIYHLARDFFNKRIGLYAALLLAISPFAVYRAQEAKHYSLLLLLSIISWLYFNKALKSDKKSIYIMSGIINMLFLLVHPYALLGVIAQILFLIIYKIDKKAWLRLQLSVLVGYLGLIVIPHFNPFFKAIAWIDSPRINILVETFQTFAFFGRRGGGNDFIIDPKLSNSVPNLLLTLIFLGLLILGVLKGRKEGSQNVKLLLWWLFFPIVTAYIVSITLKPIYLIKHFTIVLPAFYLIAANGLSVFKQNWRRWIILLGLVSLMSFPLKVLYFYPDLKIQWREAGFYVQENSWPGDSLVIAPLYHLPCFWYYYHYGEADVLAAVHLFGVRKVNGWDCHFNDQGKMILGLEEYNNYLTNDGKIVLKKILIDQNMWWAGILKAHTPFWLVVSCWVRPQERDSLEKEIESNGYVKNKEQLFIGVKVVRYINK